jgi:hypothetical protein
VGETLIRVLYFTTEDRGSRKMLHDGGVLSGTYMLESQINNKKNIAYINLHPTKHFRNSCFP